MAMEYRKLPKGEEKLSVIGLGTSFMHLLSQKEIANTINTALDGGINVIDFLSHRGQAIEGMAAVLRERGKDVFLQHHFGVHFPDDQYTKLYDLDAIKRTIETDLKLLDRDYINAALFSNIDNEEEYGRMTKEGGIWDYMQELKKAGVVRHFGFASHDISMCNKLLDIGGFDMFMLSQNAAADFSPEGGKLILHSDRQQLFQRCQKEGVGITCMKSFFGGKLLDAELSPFGVALSPYQCIKYNLDRPAIMSCLIGVQNEAHVRDLLGYFEASEEQKDYSVLGKLEMENITNTCIYCNHCQPCPAGIDIAAVNMYKDLAQIGDTDAIDHYRGLSAHAGDCIGCRACEARCPFHLSPFVKMQEAKEFFKY
ncbi:MAG: aldo/keto reductase [Clostridia bacterium]|nr:aldo/keto reductase [Clostridia bacterium]